jgi:hypothetical protein
MSKREWDNYIDNQGPVPSGFKMDYVDLLTVSGKLLQKNMITQKEYDNILQDVISIQSGDTSVAVRAPNVGAPLPSSGVSSSPRRESPLPSNFLERGDLPARRFPSSPFAKPMVSGEEFAAQIEERLKKLEPFAKKTESIAKEVKYMSGPDFAAEMEARLEKLKEVDKVDGAAFAKSMEDRVERVQKVSEATDLILAVQKKYRDVMAGLVGQLLQLKEEGAVLTESQEETIKRFAKYGYGKPRKCRKCGGYKVKA